MCEILITCQKCKKVLTSIDAKIWRTNRALKHCSPETRMKLEGVLEGLEFVKKRLSCLEVIKETGEL